MDDEIEDTSALEVRAHVRRAPRVRPAPGDVAPVQIDALSAGQLEGQLRDVSMVGVGLVFPRVYLSLLQQLPPELALELRLDPESQPLLLRARPVHRRPTGSSRVHVGLAFDDLDTPRYRESRRRLMGYIASRQRRADAEE